MRVDTSTCLGLFVLAACATESPASDASASVHLLLPAGIRADTVGMFRVDLFERPYTYRPGPAGARGLEVLSCGPVPLPLARLALDRAFVAAGLALRHEGTTWFLVEDGPSPEAAPLIVASTGGFSSSAPGRTEPVDGGVLLVTTADLRAEALEACAEP